MPRGQYYLLLIGLPQVSDGRHTMCPNLLIQQANYTLQIAIMQSILVQKFCDTKDKMSWKY